MKKYSFTRGTKTCTIWDHKGHLKVKITGFSPRLTSITSNLNNQQKYFVCQYFLAVISNRTDVPFMDITTKKDIQNWISNHNFAQIFGSPWTFERQGW